jgi:DNA mismatch repair ATPase MutS
MFGFFVGVFLPKLSNIFQKRFEAKKQIDNKIQNLSETTKQLQKTYDDQKEAAIKDTQDHIDAALANIREAQENRMKSLEREIQQELKRLQDSYRQQSIDFDESYKDIISEAVTQTLAKLGIRNGC